MIAAQDSRLPEAERPPPIATSEMLDIAVELLAVNYRVGRVELSERGLGVLATDGSLVAIGRAACDMEAAEADALGKLRASGV